MSWLRPPWRSKLENSKRDLHINNWIPLCYCVMSRMNGKKTHTHTHRINCIISYREETHRYTLYTYTYRHEGTPKPEYTRSHNRTTVSVRSLYFIVFGYANNLRNRGWLLRNFGSSLKKNQNAPKLSGSVGSIVF